MARRSIWPRNGTVLGWSDPTLAHASVAKVICGGRSSPTRNFFRHAHAWWAFEVKQMAVTVQAGVEESVKAQLELYAEFIDASTSYIITETLKLLFHKDDDFRGWADQHTNNHNKEKAKGEVLRRPSSKHETPSNPIRRAREYSVLKTACLTPCSKYSLECNLH